ncbi:MAG: MerR family transcriptional regulator [Armatimonadetes bacterium]|jgi:DNA-binding transcriptional MerR regulator|nr:MerR family transcriptional regulator [Armatimonadota bacterium]
MNSSRHRKAEKGVSISMASEITGVEVHTLRYWEKEFEGFLNPIRTAGGQRRYRAEDIQTVLVLRKLLREEMFSIAGARKYLMRRTFDQAA